MVRLGMVNLHLVACQTIVVLTLNVMWTIKSTKRKAFKASLHTLDLYDAFTHVETFPLH